VLYLFAVVCPPLAVLGSGGKSKQAWLNLLLTACFWVPGVIHAFTVINESKSKHDSLYAYEPKPREELSYSLPRIK
jgi:uncharacterized membrane protein YqaE (UPF0057 family)